MKKVLFAALVSSLFAFASYGQTHVTNVPEAHLAMRLTSLDGAAPLDLAERLSRVKIAVLGTGFTGLRPGMLPTSAQLIEGPVNPFRSDSHDRYMAMAAWAFSGRLDQGPQFFLINADGFSNFKAAVDYIIEHDIDIVLYSRTWWEIGGNGDGRGFVNAEVSRAIANGAVWINAADNLGGRVYMGPVPSSEDATLRIRVLEDSASVRIIGAWNDFTDQEESATSRDLDFELIDQLGRVVAVGNRVQGREAQTGQVFSRHPREVLQAVGAPLGSGMILDRGEYRLRTRVRHGSFTSPQDRMRIVVTGERPESVEFVDANRQGELFAPADHPDVITVGSQHDYASRGADVIFHIPAIEFSDGAEIEGTSIAAAVAAGIAARLKAITPAVTSAEIRRALTNEQAPQAEPSRPASVCYRPLADVPGGLSAYLPVGTRFVESSTGARFALLNVPVTQIEGLQPFFARGLRPGAFVFYLRQERTGGIVARVETYRPGHRGGAGEYELRYMRAIAWCE